MGVKKDTAYWAHEVARQQWWRAEYFVILGSVLQLTGSGPALVSSAKRDMNYGGQSWFISFPRRFYRNVPYRRAEIDIWK